MKTFSKVYIPYNGYYSTPFTRWQGSMQNENPILRSSTISITGPLSPTNTCSTAITGQRVC